VIERLFEIATTSWQGPFSTVDRSQAIEALELGKVLYLPELGFSFQDDEKRYLSSGIADTKSKNVQYNIHKDELKGTSLPAEEQKGLHQMMSRFANQARVLVEQLLPHYIGNFQQGRTSFRPVEALGRSSSYRKDDTRLHVDAFPSTPTAGKRILRVFTNVNPEGIPRHWRVGEPFDKVVERFLPRLSKPNRLAAKLLRIIHLTRGERTPYDHYMHRLHNAMKADLEYQHFADQEHIYFPSGSTWIVYSDQVSHAAMSGQFLFEQTFYLPLKHMMDEQRAPLRILEQAVGRPLL
jgi:hypothetical protein